MTASPVAPETRPSDKKKIECHACDGSGVCRKCFDGLHTCVICLGSGGWEE